MQKVTIVCDNCETKCTIRLADEFDDVRVGFCPACGDPLDIEDSDEESDE